MRKKLSMLLVAAFAITAAVGPTAAEASKWCVSKSGDGSTVCARDGADAGTGGHESFTGSASLPKRPGPRAMTGTGPRPDAQLTTTAA